MSFILRQARPEDLDSLYDLSRQFSLLNLPPDKNRIREKIEMSENSFAGQLPRSQATYLFVLYDNENKRVAGSSQVVAQHGTEENPNYSFEVLKKERFSSALGVGFIHQILRLKINSFGPTELGGLVVDRAYRRRPEKVGKWVSLGRFIYVGMNLDRFADELHAEMAPPLTDEGRSEFWEALGRRFTGMPYQEADVLSQTNKEFIRSLFPEEDIYLALLDSRARLVLGQVGSETRPALAMLESQGFKYKHEVDPFDGGPHIGVKTREAKIIKEMQTLKLVPRAKAKYNQMAYVGYKGEEGFVCDFTPVSVESNEVALPKKSRSLLKLTDGDKLSVVLL